MYIDESTYVSTYHVYIICFICIVCKICGVICRVISINMYKRVLLAQGAYTGLYHV